MEARHGKLLGRYEIVAEIGRGAMGTVYKARDPKIDRLVAIKTILLHQSALQEQREFRERFFVEAQAAGRLLHPGIVTVFDMGEEPDTSDPYIVMEFIEGRTLRDLLAGETKKLPLDRALQITQELAEALDYAHAQGVVHRDIKPANILITKEGQAKIGDFGIAQLDLAHMTLPGRVLGTPAYMSPEQLEGRQVDGRSDLFSLGAILYSVSTGFNPFQGNSATTVCFKVANRDPLQATTLAPELPPELDAIIARALAKNPAKRYQSGREFARDLQALRQRAAACKAKLWFSTAEGRRRVLDDTAKIIIAPVRRVPRNLSKAPPLSTGTAPNLPSIFHSSRIQAGAAIALFLASIVLGLFSWRQIRKPSPAPIRVAENAHPASAADSAQEKTTLPPSGTEAGSQTAAQADTPQTDPQTAVETEAAVPILTEPPKKAPAVSEPKTHTVPRAATHAGSKALTRALPKDAAPAGPKIVTSSGPANAGAAGVAAVATNLVPNAPQNAVQLPHPNQAIADSNLEIHVENHFADATLAIWIDNRLAYEHALRDGHKKRLLLLGGGAKETLTIPLAAGKHALRIQVQSAAEQYDQSKTLDGEFLKGGEKVLSINFEKHTREMRVAFGAQDSATPELEPAN